MEKNRCEICLNSFHGPYEDHYAWEYTKQILKIRIEKDKKGSSQETAGFSIKMNVCLDCFNNSKSKLRLSKPCDKPLVIYDQENNSLHFFDKIEKLKKFCKSTTHSLEYGISEYKFCVLASKSYPVEWRTKNEEEVYNIYCDACLLWKDNGEMIRIKDYGSMKDINENEEYQKIMKNTNDEREFLLINNRDEAYILQKLLYDKKNVVDRWFSSIDELIEEMHSGIYYRNCGYNGYGDNQDNEDDVFIMTEDFKDYYKASQLYLSKLILIDRFTS